MLTCAELEETSGAKLSAVVLAVLAVAVLAVVVEMAMDQQEAMLVLMWEGKWPLPQAAQSVLASRDR